jgi:hypothetical protein
VLSCLEKDSGSCRRWEEEGGGRVSALLTVLARGVHTCRENPGIFVIGNQEKQVTTKCIFCRRTAKSLVRKFGRKVIFLGKIGETKSTIITADGECAAEYTV